ncbi:unnamed protein product [Penicillium nalgiovense]|nr:unnamed protein product [Penicillium nalgiovense]
MKEKKGISTLQGEAVHENQDGVKHPVEPPKNVPEESKFSSSASNAELESALNKFFGGPPYCLILSECIGAHTGPRTRKRAGKGGAQSSRLSYPIVSWIDVLSEATTADQFELQKNGMYRCHVKERVVEMSAENYHFISLGYPQRMMQSSRPSEAAQGENKRLLEMWGNRALAFQCCRECRHRIARQPRTRPNGHTPTLNCIKSLTSI